jgi:putative FmdB family regulatory protein
VPIYEFGCEACGERFERLVDAGTEAVDCRACGSKRTRRLLSSQAPPLRLAKTPGERRRQEARNAQLRERTQASFKQARERARNARPRGGGG